MIRDICPICGGQLGKEIYLQNPPNRGRKCLKCGRYDEVFRENSIRHSRNGYSIENLKKETYSGGRRDYSRD